MIHGLRIAALMLFLSGTARAERATGAFESVPVTNEAVVAAAAFAVRARAEQSVRDGRAEAIMLNRIRQAEQQVVAGMNYRLLLDVAVEGRMRAAEAIVWSQPWNQESPYRLTAWTFR